MGDKSLRPRQVIPLWVKLLYSAFVAVMVRIYLRDFGPTNFLFFCDVAVLLTFAAVWLESPLLASMPLVGIFLPQMLWVADFLTGLAGGRLTGMSSYMFDPKIRLFSRALSFFHFWLPFFVLAVVWRLGYDRRAFWVWTSLALVLMLVCYFLMPPPPALDPNQPVNINYVYGTGDKAPQDWMPPLVYLLLLMVGYPLVFFLPMHLIAKEWLPQAQTPRRADVHAQ